MQTSRSRSRRPAAIALGGLLAITALAAACGGGGGSPSADRGVDPNATEENAPGDIPDDQVFVPYRFLAGTFTVEVPEGWSRTEQDGTVTFTDKYNSIALSTAPAPAAPTVASATRDDLPALAALPGYEAGKVEPVTRSGGEAVRITYRRDSPSDAVTGRSTRLDVERYEFFHDGDEVVVVLSGAQGADNVDPWKIVTDSVRFGP